MLYRKPLQEVASWPAADIRMIEFYLSEQPAVEERTDIAIAGLRQSILQFLSKPGHKVPGLMELLPYHEPWKDREPQGNDSRYSELDREFLSALGSK